MNKEKLTEIKKNVSESEVITKEDLNWLIGQAEYGQKLERKNIELQSSLKAIGSMCVGVTAFVNKTLEGKANG